MNRPVDPIGPPAGAKAPRIRHRGFRGRRSSVEAISHPDRLFFEREIIDWLSWQATDVLLVGCAPHTQRYEALFHRRRMNLWTMDADPTAVIFGASGGRHRTADLNGPLTETFPLRFDAIIVSALVRELDPPDALARALQILTAIARPGAAMVVGWDERHGVDPMMVAEAEELFTRISGPSGGVRAVFANSSHVYDFLRLRPGMMIARDATQRDAFA